MAFRLHRTLLVKHMSIIESLLKENSNLSVQSSTMGYNGASKNNALRPIDL